MIKPEILKMAINQDKRIERAIAILKDNWFSIYDDSPFMDKMSINDVQLAKNLLENHIMNSKIDFSNYAEVHKFVINNEKYMDGTAKNELLKAFY